MARSHLASVMLGALTWLNLSVLAAAHSHVSYIIVNGEMYPGYNPKIPASRNPPNVVGWAAQNPDDGFVGPENYTSPDIICHRDAVPARAHAPVRPGDRIHVQWNGWPQSHAGPVLSYLARCPPTSPSGCAGVDKNQLRFFKIDDGAPALLQPTEGEAPYLGRGVWASDILIASNNSWLVEIPPGLEPGPYVLRHEIIALHFAKAVNGAQNYPQCLNLWVEADAPGGGGGGASGGSSTSRPASAVGVGQGMLATQMYTSHDPGIEIDIYADPFREYGIPGPEVVVGAERIPLAEQKNTQPTAWGTPVVVVAQTVLPTPVSRRFGI